MVKHHIKTKLTAGGLKVGKVHIKREIFQRDSLSYFVTNLNRTECANRRRRGKISDGV